MFRKILLLLIVFVAVVAGKPTSGETQNPSVMCKLPESRGYCRALIPRWRYDPATGKCYEFKYGGCDGNGNNFVSQKACMSFCAGV